jgi:hypothetical protein
MCTGGGGTIPTPIAPIAPIPIGGTHPPSIPRGPIGPLIGNCESWCVCGWLLCMSRFICICISGVRYRGCADCGSIITTGEKGCIGIACWCCC